MAKVSNTSPAASAPAVSEAPSGGMSIAAGADYSEAKDEGAYSTDDIVALLNPQDSGEGGELPGGADPEQGTVPEQGGEGGTDPQPVDYPMPEGWDDAMWQGTAPELRGKIDSMVKAHAEALSSREKAMQEAAAKHMQEQVRANAEMQTSLNLIRQIAEGEFANVDWQKVAQENPALYVEAQQLYNQRMSAIQQMQARVQAHAQQLQAVRAQQAQAAVDAELAATLPKVQALMGDGFEKKAFGKELVEYLGKAGVPREHIGAMTRGYELELATKAMLFDRNLEARQAAAAKVAEAPRVQEPHGAGTADGDGARIKAARAHLNKNPNSTEALAALFAAM